ncbi:MAG: hypothetical protein PVG27_09845 [Chloroflexota bacterium]|jgi:hypothetical protein
MLRGITGSDRIGIELREDTPTLEDNTVTGHFDRLSLAQGSSPRLAGGTICENTTNVRLLESAELLDSDGNEICADGLTRQQPAPHDPDRHRVGPGLFVPRAIPRCPSRPPVGPGELVSTRPR